MEVRTKSGQRMMPASKAGSRTLILLASTVVFNAVGNVLLSRGMKQVGEIVDFSPSALAPVFVKAFSNGSIWLGISSLLLFFMAYMVLLSWADLSYVQPASAIGYAAVALLGYLFLDEFVSLTRWLGVLLICGGVALVTRTAPNTTGTVMSAAEDS
jgi:drug/metabolite transporter (DMT)-like permease